VLSINGNTSHEEGPLTVTPYERVIQDNLAAAFARPPSELEQSAGATWDGEHLTFRAFGQDCRVSPEEVAVSDARPVDPIGILVSLYLRHALPVPMEGDPFRSFKDFQGSMPYQAAFSANSERILAPHVERMRQLAGPIKEAFGGSNGGMGDFSLILRPLPKIALLVVCYLADEEFPAAVNILFSANARSFMPLDGLADVAEYTSKEIIRLVGR